MQLLKKEFGGKMLNTHKLQKFSDERGTLVELMKFKEHDISEGGQVYCFSIKKDMIRGNHFHKEKHEWFVCVSGTAKLITKKEKKIEHHIMSANKPELFHMEPLTVHTLTNDQKEDAIIISYSSKEFDPEFPDTYSDIIFE